MAQAVNRQPLTAEAWVCFRASPREISSRQSGTGTGFSPNYLVSPVNIIPPWLSILTYYLRINDRPVGGAVQRRRHKQEQNANDLLEQFNGRGRRFKLFALQKCVARALTAALCAVLL
jgi:hypothetical protein